MVLRFWQSKGWVNSMYPYGWFQWYFRYWLGRRCVDDKRKINRWKGIVTRFKGKLVKMIKALMIDLMIILFHLKLDKLYFVGDMNLLKVLCYDFFFFFGKISILNFSICECFYFLFFFM